MENPHLAEAWSNRPHRVYGFNLKPFCLYYLHLLQAIDSPILKPNAPYQIQHLFQAAEICSQEWSEEGYSLERVLRPGWLRLTRNRLRVLTCRFLTQAGFWSEYYSDFIAIVPKWENTGEEYDEFGTLIGKKQVAGRKDLERAMATASTIICHSHWTESKVMMMPIGRALAWADYFAIKMDGADIQFVTAEEAEIQRKTDAAFAAAEKEKNGTPATQ